MPPKKDPKAVEQVPKEPEPEPQPYQLTGFGRFQYLNGVIYEGNWMILRGKKMKHGYGKLTIPTKEDLPVESYEGDWQQDSMHGFGIYHYPDGSIYHGEWQNNKHSGQGTFEFPNGTKYTGQWSNHLMNGAGQYTDHLGRKWKGEYRNGIFDSRGQRNLFKELAINKRETELTVQVKKIIDQILVLLKAESKQFYKITPFFFDERLYSKYATIKSLKYQDKANSQWIEIFQVLKGGKYIALKNRKQSSILPTEHILTEQMQGPGQIMQISADSTSCAFISIGEAHWVLAQIIKGK